MINGSLKTFLLTFVHMLMGADGCGESFSPAQTGHTREHRKQQSDNEDDDAAANDGADEVRTVKRRL